MVLTRFFVLVACLLAVLSAQQGASAAKSCRRVRKPWEEYTQQEKDTYLKAVGLGMEKGYYALFTKVHANQKSSDQAHNTCGFILWHRRLLLAYENMLRSFGDEFKCVTIPVWNVFGAFAMQTQKKCRSMQECSPLLQDLGGSKGIDKTLQIESRKFGPNCVQDGPVGKYCDGPNMDPKQCTRCIPRGNWDSAALPDSLSFSNLVRILTEAKGQKDLNQNIQHSSHDHVHSALKGVMGSFYSPLDPVFYSLHTTVDMLHHLYYTCNINEFLTDKEKKELPKAWEACSVSGGPDTKATSNITMQYFMGDKEVSVVVDDHLKQFYKDVPNSFYELVDATDLGSVSYSYRMTTLLTDLMFNDDSAVTCSQHSRRRLMAQAADPAATDFKILGQGVAANPGTVVPPAEVVEAKVSLTKASVLDPEEAESVQGEAEKTTTDFYYKALDLARKEAGDDKEARDMVEMMECKIYNETVAPVEDFTPEFRFEFNVPNTTYPRCYELLVVKKKVAIKVPDWRPLAEKELQVTLAKPADPSVPESQLDTEAGAKIEVKIAEPLITPAPDAPIATPAPVSKKEVTISAETAQTPPPTTAPPPGPPSKAPTADSPPPSAKDLGGSSATTTDDSVQLIDEPEAGVADSATPDSVSTSSMDLIGSSADPSSILPQPITDLALVGTDPVLSSTSSQSVGSATDSLGFTGESDAGLGATSTSLDVTGGVSSNTSSVFGAVSGLNALAGSAGSGADLGLVGGSISDIDSADSLGSDDDEDDFAPVGLDISGGSSIKIGSINDTASVVDLEGSKGVGGGVATNLTFAELDDLASTSGSGDDLDVAAGEDLGVKTVNTNERLSGSDSVPQSIVTGGINSMNPLAGGVGLSNPNVIGALDSSVSVATSSSDGSVDEEINLGISGPVMNGMSTSMLGDSSFDLDLEDVGGNTAVNDEGSGGLAVVSSTGMNPSGSMDLAVGSAIDIDNGISPMMTGMTLGGVDSASTGPSLGSDILADDISAVDTLQDGVSPLDDTAVGSLNSSALDVGATNLIGASGSSAATKLDGSSLSGGVSTNLGVVADGVTSVGGATKPIGEVISPSAAAPSDLSEPSTLSDDFEASGSLISKKPAAAPTPASVSATESAVAGGLPALADDLTTGSIADDEIDLIAGLKDSKSVDDLALRGDGSVDDMGSESLDADGTFGGTTSVGDLDDLDDLQDAADSSLSDDLGASPDTITSVSALEDDSEPTDVQEGNLLLSTLPQGRLRGGLNTARM
ncbi:hypothetical protein Poli38472_007512 [Pythium oligandrum]|uniref:Tyrosinase copper-binding domain-containing protein n=1 Tax=Pythium oligandrum TaxID=41045 RepID=A0A8K1CQT5_PYTOL|nr:hypothetical protein Poli38472_007512 [Pythium oligandrum]|eukprot:TMW67840.1 hypothetical protein Poli38472_007512 [Pythium oligandrum]